MADAGVIKAGDRLPWLEPYRPPSRKASNRSAGFAAIVGVAGLAGIATLLATRIVPLPEGPTEPTAEVALPPAMIKIDPVPAPLSTQVETPIVQRAEIGRQSITAQRPHRTVRRRIKAEPTRAAYRDVVQEQAGQTALASNISAEAMAIALMPAPPADPPRPSVNPSAKVVRGKTVQMGVYKTALQAEIAWRSAIKDYTYLVTMPKSIQPIRIRSKLYYRLQLGTPSKSHARQLCGNLKQIGRSCTVV
jgi:hypothetical protein